ncbi:MAG: riboflavin synthase [Actinobacteria bacterium HGW-Actinobacteria-10]|jgi:riboflavin synthase|nr:MAG: riboflavin synthase [Actinobacteria bacterium HGW-Actinobacteria-10]
MFTGIIESEGIITRAEKVSGGMRLEVYAPEFGRDMAIGDSIAVDGSCLTVVKFIRGAFLADVSEETLKRTTLGSLRQSSKVNLERALRMSDRFGGHIVTGHVDGLGSLVMRHAAGNSTIYQFSAPRELMEFIVPKGSVAIDGISLTVADTRDDGFACAVIPHTEQTTTLKDKPIGGAVNLEVDMLGKYVKRFVSLYMGADDDSDPGQGRRGLGDMLRDFADGR